VHHFQHEVFEDHAQAPSTNFALERQLGNGVESVVGKAEAHVFKFEEALILLEQRVLGLGQDSNKRGLIEIVHHAGDGQTADKFRDQAVTDQITRLHLLEQFGIALLRRGWNRIGVEPECASTGALLDDFFKPYESATTQEKNVGGIHRSKFLVRVLAAALRRNVGNRALQYLEQRLLHAFAGNVAGNGGVLVLLGDLVDLIDINDALLRFLYVAVGGLQQLQDNV